MGQMSRRKLLHEGAQAVVAGSVALSAIPALESRAFSEAPPQGVDYYQKLGVTPFINAAGTYTILSASTMPDEVQAAVALAARQPVNLNELLDASGAYLAKRLRCEAALVTSGAAGALVLGTAACVTMGNEQSILDIPTDMARLKNEVIVQKAHRYDYDHALRNCGIRFVEVETLEQIRASVHRPYSNGSLLQCRRRKDQPRRLCASGPSARSPLFQRCRRRCSADL